MSHSRLWRSRRGVAALEFAIVAPVFVLVYVVGADIVMMMRNRFRVEQAAVQGAQVISQFTSLYADDFTNTIYPIISAIAGNGSSKAYSDTAQVACAVTISGLDYPATGKPRAGQLSIVWQRLYNNLNDSVCTANRVGAFDQNTNAPTAPTLNKLNNSTSPYYTPPSGVPFIVVEVASEYKLTGLSAVTLSATQLQYSFAIAMPRQRALPPVTAGKRP